MNGGDLKTLADVFSFSLSLPFDLTNSAPPGRLRIAVQSCRLFPASSTICFPVVSGRLLGVRSTLVSVSGENLIEGKTHRKGA